MAAAVGNVTSHKGLGNRLQGIVRNGGNSSHVQNGDAIDMAFASDAAFPSERERRNNRMAAAVVGRNNHVTITNGGLGNQSHPNGAVRNQWLSGESRLSRW